MSAPEASTEPSLFDQRSHEALPETPQKPAHAEQAAARSEPVASDLADARDTQDSAEPSERSEAAAPTVNDRKRLEEQLDALKRKEFELRRALAVADHPGLGEAIRAIEGRAFAVSRAEAKLAQGLSKSEARRSETIEKKLGALREKRAELDVQISALESELAGLGTERLTTFESERRQALEQLLIALGTHDAALSSAGMEANSLVPEITRWLPEIETLAKQLSAE
jgi:hypothetical protein